MRRLFFLHLVICLYFSLGAQDILNAKFEKRLASLLSHDVPELSVEKLHSDTVSNFIILDAREEEEYNISHIPGARYIGYDNFSFDNISDLKKNQPIVIYCSVGYRSEKITRKLSDAGYTNVHNLLGSIFEWANRNYPIVDNENNRTNRVHTYNKKWSQWIDHPNIKKVW